LIDVKLKARPNMQHEVAPEPFAAVLTMASQDADQRGPDSDPQQTGQATLELLQRAVDKIQTREAKAHEMVRRAFEELKTVRAEACEWEARAMQAEKRAEDAERWLMRLHETIQDSLHPWHSDPAHAAKLASAA
jgi:hypothetical protein